MRRALQPREATYLPFRETPQASRSTRAWACISRHPYSYTGEDVLELQAHGGPVVLQLLLARCLRLRPWAHP